MDSFPLLFIESDLVQLQTDTIDNWIMRSDVRDSTDY